MSLQKTKETIVPETPVSARPDNTSLSMETVTAERISSEAKEVFEKRVSDIAEEPARRDPPSGNMPKPKKELPKQSALGAMISEIHKEVVVSKEENKTELTEETLESIWKEFLSEHKGKLQNAFMSVAEKQLPKLFGDVITFTESNNISLELLQLHKMDILGYFRKRTTSPTASLAFKLLRNDTQKNYKTSKDRLKDMIQDNPSVLKLIEKLDLNEY